MTTYFHKLKTILAAFTLLLLNILASSTTNAASQELQTSSKFAPIQIADLTHPGAAVVHHRNAKARRHSVANQPAESTSTTKPK